jgi:hypothetical protein
MVSMPARSARVDDTAAMLASEFGNLFSLEMIRRATSETAVRFEGSRVIEFVPLLTYRFTRERLLAEARAQSGQRLAS